jgi:hypothetical protein
MRRRLRRRSRSRSSLTSTHYRFHMRAEDSVDIYVMMLILEFPEFLNLSCHVQLSSSCLPPLFGEASSTCRSRDDLHQRAQTTSLPQCRASSQHHALSGYAKSHTDHSSLPIPSLPVTASDSRSRCLGSGRQSTASRLQPRQDLPGLLHRAQPDA